MNKGLNKVMLIGFLGADPDGRFTSDGTAVTSFSLATSEAWKDKEAGEKKESTEWHKVVFFRRLARVASEHLKKGSHVYIEGRNRTRKWTDKGGVDHYTTEVIASELNMLGGKPGAEVKGGDVAPASSIADNFDDDIPF